MKCWICEQQEATTGEHIIKASDIATLYPTLSTEQPAYLREEEGDRPRKIFSKKNSNLKFEKSLCAKCNNELTQPHDQARDRFMRVLLDATRTSKFGGIRAATMFPRDTQRELLNTQLFFAKLFGCTLIEEEVSFDTSGLAKCIREGTPVADLWIAASSYERGKRSLSAARGPVKALTRGDTIIVMYMMYYVDTLVLFLALSLPPVRTVVPRRSWKPTGRVSSIRFAPVFDLPHRTKWTQGGGAILNP